VDWEASPDDMGNAGFMGTVNLGFCTPFWGIMDFGASYDG